MEETKLSEQFLERARNRINEAEKQLIDARALIARLRKAGEDVSAQERQASELEYKIQRYKEAFKD